MEGVFEFNGASYVLVKPKLLASLMAGIRGSASHAIAFVLKIRLVSMEEVKRDTKNKGGRPAKAILRNKLLGVKCTKVEAFVIKSKAEKVQLTVSEYLREIGLNGKIDIRKKAIPTEVLQAIARLNHIAANVNQIAKKRNSFDELNAMERAELHFIVGQLKQFVKDFKNYFE